MRRTVALQTAEPCPGAEEEMCPGEAGAKCRETRQSEGAIALGRQRKCSKFFGLGDRRPALGCDSLKIFLARRLLDSREKWCAPCLTTPRLLDGSRRR